MTANTLTNTFISRRSLALGSAATMAAFGGTAAASVVTAQHGTEVTIAVGEDGYISDARQRIGFMPFNTNIFEALVRLNPDYTISPMLAESWELIEPGTWRFHLRPDVTFHNGAPLTRPLSGHSNVGTVKAGNGRSFPPGQHGPLMISL